MGDLVLRQLFPLPFDYVGLDIVPGDNVDFVPADAYQWTELETESFDVVLSNQTFEHIPFFWITAAEIARVLRPGGLVCVIAPSRGKVHQHPLDCWRFYPDSWQAVCDYTGLELLETYREKESWRMVVPGAIWGDAMMIARKPTLTDDIARKEFYQQLATIVATRKVNSGKSPGSGPAGELYEQTHTADRAELMRHPFSVGRRVPPLHEWPGLNRVSEGAKRRNRARSLRRGEAAMPWPGPPRPDSP
jgi:SAM-dependent methyltransferase